jgi:competence protein ComEC
MNLFQFPIVRITFWLILGIMIAYYSKLKAVLGFELLAIAAIVFFCFYFTSNKKFKQNSLFGISLYFLCFTVGIATVNINNDTLKIEHYIHSKSNFEGDNLYEVIIREQLRTSINNNRYVSIVKKINGKIASGKIILNFKKNGTNKLFIVGQKLQIKDQLIKNFKPNNPNQFDYRNYLETKGIYAQIFTQASQVKISNQIEKDVWYYTAYFRNRIIKNLIKNGFNKNNLGVIIALILGQQQDISPEVIKDYQYAGAIHILSVSGLHVGFIMLFTTFLLLPLPQSKFGNFLRLVIVISCLWLFAVVAGLAPSVVRSAAMFSFIALGKYLNREPNMSHTIIVSVFLILLFEPMFLFDIGFQLSYIAVFFILWLQPLLKLLWSPRNKITTYFWDILTVSFAAQIGTLPLSIYYFHQFPSLFFVTNLVLIPSLSAIMILGLILMIFAFFDKIPLLLSQIVDMCIAVMNCFIKCIASFETFIIKDIPLSFTLLLSLYFLIFTWIIWLKKPNFYKISLALTSVLLFQTLLIANHFIEQSKNELVIFNVKRKTMIGERKGEFLTLLSPDTLSKSNFEKQMLQSYIVANFIKKITFKKLTNTYFFNQNKILIIDKFAFYKSSLKPDIIVLRDSPKINMERLLSYCRPKIIIADASNYKSYVTAWKQSCLKTKTLFYSTYENGFYKID